MRARLRAKPSCYACDAASLARSRAEGQSVRGLISAAAIRRTLRAVPPLLHNQNFFSFAYL